MKKEEIQKNIDEATKNFKETLEKTYLEKGEPFYGAGFHNLMWFFSGKCSHRRMNDGSLKITGNIPKICFRDSCNGVPMGGKDYAIFPMVVTLFQDDIGETK
jgi:hypothetical protein